MQPAYSVIFFTTASGAGYGLLVWLALAGIAGFVPPARGLGLAGFGTALALITAGLLSSSLHLGHPERAWRAFSQWRSSWLSREGVAAVLSYLPALVYAGAWVLLERNTGGWALAGAASAALALVTVGCTAMIYASLAPVPMWSNRWVLPVYLALALASGLLLFELLIVAVGDAPAGLGWLAAAVSLAAWTLKVGYWNHVDRAPPVSTAESATGLGAHGPVRLFEGPNTSAAYIMREMGFQVARRHALKLRRVAFVAGGLLASALALLAPAAPGGADILLAGFAVLTGAVGVLVERWLFFAEARHLVTLYYGASAV